jgi:pimeloyl-ACP methyl ester carboxylesterase
VTTPHAGSMNASYGRTMRGISFATAGSEGPAVLLIMGFGLPGNLWANQVEALRHHHHVAWFDNRGAGMSRTQKPLMTMADMQRDALDVMDALGWDSAHVVGISMGGMVAQELALRATERVRSLTLIATHAGGLRNLTPPAPGLALFLAGFLGPRRLRTQVLAQLLAPGGGLSWLRPSQATGIDAKRFAAIKSGNRRDRVAQVSAVLRHATAHRLHRLETVPTLVVVAGRDRLVRSDEAMRLHHLIPGSRLVVYDHAGHGLLSQCADALNNLLLEHFRQHHTV